jgi:RNA polymerase sigma factor (sigma-70 family)
VSRRGVNHRDPVVVQVHETDGVQLRAEDEHECASHPLLVVGDRHRDLHRPCNLSRFASVVVRSAMGVRMRKADEDRFWEFARSHAMAMRRRAFPLCGDWHLAEDLVQTELIKMHCAWPRVVRTDRPVGYARKTLLRCWLDERRRPWRRAERRDGLVPGGAGGAVGPAWVQQQQDLRGGLFDALSAIPPRQRAVLVLRCFESLSIVETAEALGCSEGMSRARPHAVWPR